MPLQATRERVGRNKHFRCRKRIVRHARADRWQAGRGTRAETPVRAVDGAASQADSRAAVVAPHSRSGADDGCSCPGEAAAQGKNASPAARNVRSSIRACSFCDPFDVGYPTARARNTTHCAEKQVALESRLFAFMVKKLLTVRPALQGWRRGNGACARPAGLRRLTDS